MLMVSRFHRPHLVGILALVLLVALLAACDSQAHAGTPAATSTATSYLPMATQPASGGGPSPTATTTPNGLSSPPANPLAVCTSNGGAALTVQQADLSPLVPTGARLPDNFPLKPVVYPPASSQQTVSLNASEQMMYSFSAPPAKQVGYICGVTMRIVSFQPIAAPIPNVTLPCVDQSYLDPGGWEPSSGCPGAAAPAGEASVRFSSSTQGATATSAMIDPLAKTLRPGQTPPAEGPNDPPYMLVGIQVPAAGTYTFSVSFWQTRSGPTIAAPSITATFALGQYLHEWGGQQCTVSGMHSQLPPPTNPPSHVICPGPPQQH